MGLSSDREESDTKASSIYSRPCIFHGFKTIYEVDAKDCKGQYVLKYIKGGIQCGLTGETCPIQWEGVGWSECPLENKEELIESLGEAKVYPRDLWPEKARSLDGVSLKEWMDYAEKGRGEE